MQAPNFKPLHETILNWDCVHKTILEQAKEFYLNFSINFKGVDSDYADRVIKNLVSKIKPIIASHNQQGKRECALPLRTLFPAGGVGSVALQPQTRMIDIATAIQTVVRFGGVECSWEDPETVNLKWIDPHLFNHLLVQRDESSGVAFLHGRIQEARKQKTLVDFTLVVQGHEIPVHRFILGLSSPAYFGAVAMENMQEMKTGRLVIQNFDVETVERAIDFIYMGECLLKNANAQKLMELLRFAYEYQVPDLSLYSAGFLMRFISVEDVIPLCLLSVQHQDKSLLIRLQDTYVRWKDSHNALLDLDFDLNQFSLAHKDDLLQVGELLQHPKLIAAAQAMQ